MLPGCITFSRCLAEALHQSLLRQSRNQGNEPYFLD